MCSGGWKPGWTCEAAIVEAQELGYAEANPAADIEGYDVQLKVLILANELLGAGMELKDVQRQGISDSDAGEGPGGRPRGTALEARRRSPAESGRVSDSGRVPDSAPRSTTGWPGFPARPMRWPSIQTFWAQ